MKPGQVDLLDAWTEDQEVSLPDLPAVHSLWPMLYPKAQSELAWLAETVKGAKQDEEDVFDRLYRRGHILAGMAALLHLPRATHLLGVLDFALNLARSLQTFERHSLAYVVELLITAAREVLDDLHAMGRCERDLSEILEECRTYLAAPLRQCLAPPPPAPAAPSPPATPTAGDTRGPTPSTPVATPPPKQPDFDDSPEDLQFPPDKVGLTSDFCEEARESLARVGSRLVELEVAAEPLPIINDVFRAVHTVKGGARLFKIRKMESLAHCMESLLDEVRQGSRQVNPALIDGLLAGQKLLEEMVEEVASRGPLRTLIGPCLATLTAPEFGTAPPSGSEKGPLAPAQAGPAAAAAVAAPRPVPAEAGPRSPTATDSIRIPTEKLDDVLNTASEVFISRIRLASDVAAINTAIHHFRQTLQRIGEFNLEVVLERMAEANRRLVNDLRGLMAERGGSVSTTKLSALVNRFHKELAGDTQQQHFSIPEELTFNLLSIDEVRKRLQRNVEQLEQLSSRLQTGAMGFRMVPIAHLFDRFPTQVRESARQMGKKIRLEVNGGDTELDKVLINQLADPLLHILRNAIDHGVEMPEERVARGKPEVGQLFLRAYYHGSHAVIEVRDDGRGIDANRVLAKAVERQLVEPEKAAALTRQEIFEFIFEPGFSTASTVSTMSGRGVGMDVVKTAINQVQGSITIESVPNEGTSISMKLPLTLAVVSTLLVRERGQQFAFPIQHIDEILTVQFSEIRRVSDNAIYNHRGTTLSVTTLSSILEFPPSLFTDDEVSLVVLIEGEKKVGVLVDAVLGRQEVLIKNLGSLIKQAPFVMGCTILSDSQLVLILNAWEIVNARSWKPFTVAQSAGTQDQAARKSHSILVVDDSALQRSHLKAILTHAGYTVETSDNGFEALKSIRHRRHSAFCVDVIMPLMDGFEFVERLRRLPGHLHSPVLFITGRARDTERDRARNLDVAHYFQKPIDPQTLVETLDRCCLTKVRG